MGMQNEKEEYEIYLKMKEAEDLAESNKERLTSEEVFDDLYAMIDELSDKVIEQNKEAFLELSKWYSLEKR